MIVSSFRIVKTKRASTAFDGEGARLYGARWNSLGTAMVYTSEHASLAQLEMLVHIDKSLLLNSYSLIEAEFDDKYVETLDVSLLPKNWNDYPAPAELQQLGDLWTSQKRSVVLGVPSVTLNTEVNFLINPNHPDFSDITILTPIRIKLDSRLK